MRHPWPELKWWNSGERQVVEEKIDDLVKDGKILNPVKARMYDALRSISPGKVKAVIVGQDPYPTEGFATGLAFSIPRTITPRDFPQTLRIILNEYRTDLGYGLPDHGDLSGWAAQGVLLWNAIPIVQAGHPLSCDWGEWRYLTGEVIRRVAQQGAVFALLGGVARSYESDISPVGINRVITTSHPSPRGVRNSKSPFTGSRVFSTINARLVELGKEPINWELKDGSSSQGNLPRSDVVGGSILPNITGADLGGLKGKNAPNLYVPA